MNTSILKIGFEPDAPPASQSASKRSSGRSDDFSQALEAGAGAINHGDHAAQLHDPVKPKEEKFERLLEDQIKTDQSRQSGESKADTNKNNRSTEDAQGDRAVPHISAGQAAAKSSVGYNQNPVVQLAKAIKPGMQVSAEAKNDITKAAGGVSQTAKQNAAIAGHVISETVRQSDKSPQADKAKKSDNTSQQAVQVQTGAKLPAQQQGAAIAGVDPEKVQAKEASANAGLHLNNIAAKGGETESSKSVTHASSSHQPAAAKVSANSGQAADNANTGADSRPQQEQVKEAKVQNPVTNDKAHSKDVIDTDASDQSASAGKNGAPVGAGKQAAADTRQNSEHQAQPADPKVSAASSAVANAKAEVVSDLPTQKNAQGPNVNVPAAGAGGSSADSAGAGRNLADDDIVSVQVRRPAVQSGQAAVKHEPAAIAAGQPKVPDQAFSSEAAPVETSVSSVKETSYSNAPDGAGRQANISQQLETPIQSAIAMGGRQVIIRLDPPELGRVALKFSENNSDQITGVLEVDKAQTRDQIQRQLPEIIQNLNNSGVQVKKIEVILSSQNEYGASKEQSANTGQNPWSQQQETSDNGGFRRNNAGYERWSGDADRAVDTPESSVQYFDESINMLV